MIKISSIVTTKRFSNRFYVVYDHDKNSDTFYLKGVDTIVSDGTVLENGLCLKGEQLIETNKRPKSAIHTKLLEQWSAEIESKEKWKHL